jgi:hypothetical protein
MQLQRRGFLLASAVSLLAFSSRRAFGSVARALSLGELVRSSERALVGAALEAHSRWATVGGRRRIVTETRIRVDRAVAGASDGSELMVQTLGGQVGDVGQVVFGEAFLLVGEAALLFLVPDAEGELHVAGMAQGHYPIRKGSDGSERLVPSPRSPELIGDASAAKHLVGRGVGDACDIVRKAWRNAR